MQFRFGDLLLDMARRELRRGGVLVTLEPQVFDLLVYLVRNRDRVVTKDDILNAVWSGRVVSESTLTTRITAARRAIGDSGEAQRLIRTSPRKGFRFVGEVAEATPAETPPPESRPPLALPDRPSIAVLPFQNMSGDPEQEYFADGITEDLTTALSKLRGFFVIARNSTFAYKDQAPDVRQVARELGVRYVLEGSVRKSGERLRVTGQLIDASTGSHIWAERYDRPVADIFAVQDEITASIVGTIEGKLYDAENLRVKTRPTESLDAWGCVVRAWSFASTVGDSDGEIRLSLLRRAVELDPGYALAHALIAWVHAGLVHYGKGDYDREIAMALKSARRAITLDPDDHWGHHALGFAYNMSRRTDQAIEELNAALARNPNFARSEMVLGGAYAHAGRIDEAMRHLAIATRLSPRDVTEAPILYICGLCHFLAGRYSESIVSSRRSVELRPEYVAALTTLAAAAGLAGDVATAGDALAEAKRCQPSLSIDWIERYHPLVRAEDRARLIDGLRKAGLT